MKQSLVTLLVLTLCAFGLSAQENSALESAVRQLFQQRCAECHGRDLPEGKRKGNKQLFLDSQSRSEELAVLKMVVVGNAEDSTLLQRVLEKSEDDRMPPKGDRLSETQADLLRQWINRGGSGRGAGVAPTAAIKRVELFRAVHADLQSLAAGVRRYMRYLTLHNLRNAGDSAEELHAYRAGVSKALNSLSSESRIVVPVGVGPDKLILRFDVRDYGWDAAKWELLAAAYPYDIEPAVLTRIEKDTRQMAGTSVPIIRADWFVFAATQPPFYDQLLATTGYPSGLPNSDGKLEQQLGIHALQNIRTARVQRAAFTDSGVSDSNRMIERHTLAQGGYYWKSYDFANERGTGDLVRNPLGPPEAGYRNAFRHDGGEIIWSLPNGLQGYMLSTSKGDVITRGPTGVVKDPFGPQGAVINGISCIRCHSAGMRQPKGGAVNMGSTHNRARGGLDEPEQALFDRLYRDASTIVSQLETDAERFKIASRRASVTEAAWFTQEEEPVFRLYARFRADITARTLASELDMDPADVSARLREYDGAGDAAMNSLIQRLPKGIKRQNFIADFALLSQAFERGNARPFRSVVFEEFRETTGSGDITGLVTPIPQPKSSGGAFINSLGMKFVRVPGVDVMFSVWETRKQDYEAYAKAVPTVDRSWQNVNVKGQKVSFAPDHPVVNTSWEDAKAFCTWLTEKERRENRLPEGASYRLPTDLEWSAAVGLPPESGATPEARNMRLNMYPWGLQFPPPDGAGNFADITSSEAFGAGWDFIQSYRDGFATTSPVGSFAVNKHGLFDLAGNVWEWCEDYHNGKSGGRVLRGACFSLNDPVVFLSACRISFVPGYRSGLIGFRAVLVGGTSTSGSELAAKGAVTAVSALVKPEFTPAPAPAATQARLFVNTLGMRFVPVSGTDVHFGVWNTRVQDYQAFARAAGRSWEKPTFAQEDTHPAVNVSWEDAKAFCHWLTEKEQREGKLTRSQSYRLPQDWEWSVAVGLNESKAGTPREKDEQIKTEYPWGKQWPPPKEAGNYSESLRSDGHENTSPVGSFGGNAFGLYDMGGNVWQWCEDLNSPTETVRVLRGASFDVSNPGFLLSSCRGSGAPGDRSGNCGFRVVLVNAQSQ